MLNYNQKTNYKYIFLFFSWDFYDAENYTAFTIRLGWTKEPICINIQTMHNVNFLRATKSLRYHGPANTTMSSLTITGDSGFYPGRNVTGHWIGGKEMIYVAQKVNDIPFSPSYIVLTGNHTWTGFSNNDLTGNSICYIPDGEFAIHNYLLESPMLSFAKGCDANVRRIKVLRVQLDPIAELYMSYCGKYNARFNLN